MLQPTTPCCVDEAATSCLTLTLVRMRVKVRAEVAAAHIKKKFYAGFFSQPRLV
jgi:hypothetical protein